jgi:acyl-CoA synthetase (AMP-forming)/AMP-acid ligase II
MGLIGYYIYPALAGGSTYGFSPFDFIQRPALWFESISKYRATATSAPNFAFDYCLRPGRIQEEAIQKADLRSLRFLMTAAEPVHPDTYARFLKTFEPFGLNPDAFYVAYGLAENTLAVSSHGRTALSLNAKALALRRVRPTTEVSAIASAKRIVSCGQPLGDVTVRIVDPEKHTLLSDGHVGEIWVTGESKCAGYWNNPELTQAAFRARVAGDNHHGPEYLRTGDLGFLHQGELYVCGRIKDTIIIRGQNYYPQDIEQIVQEASESVRRNCVVAFEFAEETEPAIAIVAEVNPRSVPDVHELVAAVRNYLNVEIAHVSLVAPKSLPKTSSGKLMRSAAKQMWLEGRFKEVARLSREGAPDARPASSSPLDALKLRYNLTGNEDHTLVEAGVDSLDLVVLMHELQETLKEKGAQSLARDVDVSLIQRIKVSELYRLADYLERNPGEAVQQIQRSSPA